MRAGARAAGAGHRGRRAAGVREPGTWDWAESEARGGMEYRAVRACLALLWGCAMVAAAVAQGKEGECVSGCWTCEAREPGHPRAPDSAPPGAGRAVRSAALESDLVPRSLGTGVTSASGLPGDWHRAPGATGTEGSAPAAAARGSGFRTASRRGARRP